MSPDSGSGREFHAEKNKGKDTEAKHFPQLFVCQKYKMQMAYNHNNNT